MDMSKYLKMFISESHEHLQRMDSALVDLEKNPQNQSLIELLFREAHSIKGMAASMGYEHLSELSHKFEDFLDAVRQQQAPFTKALADILFEGIDIIRKTIEDISAGGNDESCLPFLEKVRSGEFVPRSAGESTPLISLATVTLEPSSVAAESPISLEIPREAIEEITPERKTKYHLVIQISPEASLPDARAFLTIKKSKEIGDLIVSIPSMEDLRAGKSADFLQLIISTTKERSEIQEIFESLPEIASVLVSPLEEETINESPTTFSLKDILGPSESLAQEETLHSPPIAESLPKPKVSWERPAAAATVLGKAATIRIDASLLDDLMNYVGELITTKNRLVDLSTSLFPGPMKESVNRLNNLVTGLYDHTTKMRMIPLELIVDRLPRVVRDLSQKSQKEVDFVIKGKEIELDRAILEELTDPLVHIIRNSMDHGIESPEERLQKGKPRQGVISLEAFREKETVTIKIFDDGRGIDPVKIKTTALEKGIITKEQFESLDEKEALMLVTVSGFSTAQQVSDVSGRGVGMDVVKAKMKNLGGNLTIDSEVNMGTTISLRLPLTMAILQVLLFRVAQEKYAIPMSRVYRSVEFPLEQIQRSQKQEVVTFKGKVIPIIRLRKYLKTKNGSMPLPKFITTILVDMRGKTVGLVVDSLLEQKQAVIKPLGKPLELLPGFSGATILGDGSIVLILDPNSIY
jgi:two-component system chemotaxis sensor kinase CheA